MLSLRLQPLAAFLGALSLIAAPAAALDPRKALTQYSHHVWRTEEGLPQN